MTVKVCLFVFLGGRIFLDFYVLFKCHVVYQAPPAHILFFFLIEISKTAGL